MAGLFANAQEANIRSCVSMIEDVLASLGHSPDLSRVPGKDTYPAWRVQKGSAHVFILLDGVAGENFLRITAPVIHVDPAADKVGLYQKLLELNRTEVYGAAFALDGSVVVLTSQRSTTDLDRSEVLDLVKRVEEYADKYDDLLVDEFGGRSAGLSVLPVT